MGACMGKGSKEATKHEARVASPDGGAPDRARSLCSLKYFRALAIERSMTSARLARRSSALFPARFLETVVAYCHFFTAWILAKLF